MYSNLDLLILNKDLSFNYYLKIKYIIDFKGFNDLKDINRTHFY